MFSRIKIQKGFTLLEILLVVAMIALIGGISIPIYQSFQVRNDLSMSETIVVRSLRRAQALSYSSDGDSNWGVHIQTGTITLFKGVDYSSRDQSFDEIFDISTSITPSDIDEIAFDKLSGEPNDTGIITLTSVNGDIAEIDINEKGMINY